VIKQRYDYGVVIFILTFNLIAISGYRIENLFEMAHQRIATILIGCALCFLINVYPFPIWAGDDLHNSIIHNLEGLAGSVEGKLLPGKTTNYSTLVRTRVRVIDTWKNNKLFNPSTH